MGEEAAPREEEKKGGTAAEFEEEMLVGRDESEGGKLNCRRWANIAVHGDEGEPRCR